MRAAHALLLALPMVACVAMAQETAADPRAGLVRAGSGRLTFFGFSVYDARLWVAPGFRQATFGSHALALELAYLRGFRAADVARRSLEEMARSGPIPPEQARRWEEALARVLPDVVEGDRLLGVHRPGQGVEFFGNGRRLGAIDDPEFARRFFGIWLGPATSEPSLRDALFAGTAP